MSTEPQEPRPLCHCECCAGEPHTRCHPAAPVAQEPPAPKCDCSFGDTDYCPVHGRYPAWTTKHHPTEGAAMNRTTEQTAALTAKLYGTTDAMVWAEEWCKIARELRAEGTDVIDEGIMVGWFANAFAVAMQRGWPERTS